MYLSSELSTARDLSVSKKEIRTYGLVVLIDSFIASYNSKQSTVLNI